MRNQNNSLSHNKQATINIKLKRVREERCKYKITLRRIIEEETQILSEKPLHEPLSRNDPLVNELKYKDTKKTLDLSPLISNYQQNFWSLVFTNFSDPTIPSDCIYQASSAYFGKYPILPKLQNTLYTLYMCELCLGTNLLSRYNNRREEKKRL